MLSDVAYEISEITGKIINICDGFFTPTKIEYSLLTKQDNVPANNCFSMLGFDLSPLDRILREINFDNGVSYHDFKEDMWSIETQKNLVRYIRRIEIDGKTKFKLKGGDEYIDMNSKGLYAPDKYEQFLTPQEVFDSKTGLNPLTIDLSHDSMKSENEHVKSSDSAYYRIVFWSNTDMWFQKTEIGLVNRNRLREVLKSMHNNFDVVFTAHLSDKYSEERLNDIVFGKD